MNENNPSMAHMVGRRAVLLAGATSAAVLAVGELGCSSSTRGGGRCRAPEEALPPNLDSVGHRILGYAALAPSTHNTQPWSVRIEAPRRFLVRADLTRRLPAVDPHDRELRLSLGAFLENLTTAAGALGLHAGVSLLESWPDVARVELVDDAPTGHSLARIESRRTVRKGYPKFALDAARERTLITAAAPAAYFPLESAQGRVLSEWTLAAYRRQSARDDATHELSQWIRFSRDAGDRHCDGLTPASMELGGIAGFYARHFMGPDDVLGTTFRDGGIHAAEEQLREGAGFLVVTSQDDSTSSLIDAGRRFERCALLFRELGLGGHPMSQVLEEKPWNEQLTQAIGLSGVPQMIVRLGVKADYDPPVSLRRSVAEFVSA